MQEQEELQQLRDDVDLIAIEVARLPGERDRRIEGVRSDVEVALLQLVTNIDRRFKRLEGVVAEHLAGEAIDLTEDLKVG